jgi:hypothetical protein
MHNTPQAYAYAPSIATPTATNSNQLTRTTLPAALVGVGVAVAMYTPVGATLLPVPLALAVEFGSGVPGLPALTVLAGGVYWLEFSYQTPLSTTPFPAAMADCCVDVHVVLMARIQQTASRDWLPLLAYVLFSGPEVW